MPISKLFTCRTILTFSSYKILQWNFSLIAKYRHNPQNSRRFSSSSNRFKEENVRFYRMEVEGKEIRINEHYFDQPVPQPRPPKGHRRVADLTGLKGNEEYYFLCTLIHFVEIILSKKASMFFHNKSVV